MFPKLKGVNIFLEDWETWTYEDIDREVADLVTRGFNHVRTAVYFERFYNVTTRQIDLVSWAEYREKAIHLMNALKQAGIHVSFAPIEAYGVLNKAIQLSIYQ
ncbi:unnamed protein product [marine sediment metagenome]|uniref:Glycoside hydrolase family 42 N-terminal domain-containing protein n=1 Tax=marine sediment metagenome TaxID=412755 RepID=X1ERX1_9ZZZZ